MHLCCSAGHNDDLRARKAFFGKNGQRSLVYPSDTGISIRMSMTSRHKSNSSLQEAVKTLPRAAGCAWN
eukprot:4549218-Pleurochrysis_carterae.AAC.1